jgi:RNA methyltransferase, TrmH family
MISKNKIKYIRSLHQKKFRREENTFIAEGPKLCKELLNSKFKVKEIFGLANSIQQIDIVQNKKNAELHVISQKELERISAFSTPNQMLALVETPTCPIDFDNVFNQLILSL